MRKLWLETMIKIAEPVIENLAEGNLDRTIPKQFHCHRKDFILLEAFGRTVCGMAPWLALKLPEGEEKELQRRYRLLVRRCIENATDPASPDYMNWGSGGGQPLVDAAFLAHGIIRAPDVMFRSLEPQVKERLISCLKQSRKITPADCNWLFFSAMVEAALCVMGSDYDLAAVDYALKKFENWYAGDGTYRDGEYFHWDYYNSFVIHPMQLDILRVFSSVDKKYALLYDKACLRASRYAEVLERLINADGTYAVFGRSSVYRFGAFQLLSQTVLQELLPEGLSYASVRCALTSVISRVCENPRMFDEKGFLTPGVYGCQPDMAEEYINVGSLYLCQTVFLPLGLPEGHRFWSDKNEMWSAKKLWSGENLSRDEAID